MGKEETRALIEQAQAGSKEAMELLVEQNIKMIQKLANKYKHSGVEREDLFQIASVGFIRAVQRFDLSTGYQFSTYAYPLIHNEIYKYLRVDGTIRTPRVYQDVEKLIKKNNCYEKTPEEIAEITGLTDIDLIKEVLSFIRKRKVLSLNKVVYDDGQGGEEVTLMDTIGSEERDNFLEENIAIKSAIEKLDEREQRIFHMRFILDMSQREVAQEFGVTQAQISRLERRALGKVRVYLGLSAELPDVDKKPPKELRGKLGKGSGKKRNSGGDREKAIHLLKTSSLNYTDISKMTGVPLGSLGKMGKIHRPQYIKDIIKNRPTQAKGELNVYEA